MSQHNCVFKKDKSNVTWGGIKAESSKFFGGKDGVQDNKETAMSDRRTDLRLFFIPSVHIHPEH